jgi:hypothetical protein
MNKLGIYHHPWTFLFICMLDHVSLHFLVQKIMISNVLNSCSGLLQGCYGSVINNQSSYSVILCLDLHICMCVFYDIIISVFFAHYSNKIEPC